MPLFRKKTEPQPQQPPNIIIQVQPPQPVHVKEHTRHLPLLERPQDADARRIIRDAKLRKKLERKGLLSKDETEIERMAREAQDMTTILSESRKKEKQFDET